MQESTPDAIYPHHVFTASRSTVSMATGFQGRPDRITSLLLKYITGRNSHNHHSDDSVGANQCIGTKKRGRRNQGASNHACSTERGVGGGAKVIFHSAGVETTTLGLEK